MQVHVVIEYNKDKSIATLVIKCPETLGALRVEDYQELHDAFIDFRDDEEILVGIITGTGDKAFCSGVDIKNMLPFIKETAKKPWKIPTTIMRGLDVGKPLIAAINGLALGGGLELALACDIRIASDSARFGFPEAKVGIFPGAGGTQRLPRLVSPGIAAEMMFTGRMLDAEEAYRIGLVNRVVPKDKLMRTATEMALSICEAGPLAIKAIKEALRGVDMTLDEGLRLEALLTPSIVFSKDFEEGIKAFSDKRKPKFEGK